MIPTQLSSLDPAWVTRQIEGFLKEDVQSGDITTESVVREDTTISARIEAVQGLVFAGAQVIPHCFGDGCRVELRTDDGDDVAAGQVLATVTGSARMILTRERLMLNLVQRLSGIATQTRAYVERVASHGVLVLDTRKTTPGLRRFEKYAVAVGGGYNHRMDLSTAILIKDNHLKLIDDIPQAVARLRSHAPGLVVELEVENLEALTQGLEAGVDAFLLDNLDPVEVQVYVTVIRNHPDGQDIFIEASGGISLTNIAAYAQTGVDGISVGALTHSVPSAGIRLEITA
ncbi:MAG: carboxylating nicotinate-nucleotide diphosphorylase [Candidatus Marinimicrobia bacterium]|nr:carboxylating nicotinate-nucleotide diphosphorylase [Candidatus Neomarinimicrobiota bacterium]